MSNLHILSGGAANGLVTALTASFAQATGLAVTGDFGAVGGMRDRVVQGEAVDLIILTRAIVDQLAASGHITGSTVADLGQVVTGIAVRDGAPLPEVSTEEALRSVLLNADGIYFPDPIKATAGIHFAKVMTALGIADQVTDRLHTFPNGQTAMAAMTACGDSNPIGCTQITEILNTSGVSYAGDLPAGHALVTTYTAGVSTSAAEPDAAATLISILTAPEHANVRARAGFSD